MRLQMTKTLGSEGPEASPAGARLHGHVRHVRPTDEAESIATIHAALEAGIDLLDTGDFYGMGHNEMLIGRALEGRGAPGAACVKFGAQRGPDGSWLGYDARPAAVKNWLAYTLNRLASTTSTSIGQRGSIPEVPIEETIGAIAELIQAGYVR